MSRDALILGAFHDDGGMAEKLRQAGLALSGELSAELSATLVVRRDEIKSCGFHVSG